MNHPESLNVLSANVRGIKAESKKQDVLNYFQSIKPQILCLQHSHLTPKDIPIILK